MKKLLLLPILLSFIISKACNCDMCVLYIGIYPNDYKSAIGINYRYRYYQGQMPMNGMTMNMSDQARKMNYDLSLRAFITRKLQVSVTVPVVDNILEENNVRYTQSGLGDVMAMMRYILFSRHFTDTIAYKDRLMVAGGIKAPTGYYTPPQPDLYDDMQADILRGSGSVDYVLNATYQARIHQFGYQADVLWKINGTNKYNYRKANQLNLQLTAFTTKRLRLISMVPHIGVSAEHSDKDEWNGIPQPDTGGWVGYASAGLGLFYSKYSLSLQYDQPVVQQLNGYELQNKMRFAINFQYNFSMPKLRKAKG